MKNPKIFELMSYAAPNMQCPACGEGTMESKVDYELSILNFEGKPMQLKIHAIVCDECEYVAFTKDTLLAIASESIGTAGRVYEENGAVFTRVLH